MCSDAAHFATPLTCIDSLLHNGAPAGLGLCDLLGEVFVHQQVLQGGVALVRLLDLIQKVGPDDAAALQDIAG